MYCVTLFLFFIRRWCNLNEFPPNLTSNLCPVKLGVNPWISTHFEQYFLPGRIWPAGRIQPVKLGVNPWLKLGWNSWIYTQFEQYFLPGQIGSKSMAQIGLKFMDLHPIWAVFLARSNSTGRIGSKSMAQIGLKFMDLHPIWAVFLARSNLTGQIRPVELGVNPWLKLGWNSWIYTQFEQYFLPGRIGSKSMAQIGWKFMDLLPIHAWSNLVSSQWIQLNLLPLWAVFLARSNFKLDRAWNTAQIGLKFMDLLPIRLGINYWSNWVEIHWDYTII